MRVYLQSGMSELDVRSVPPHTTVCSASGTVRLRSFKYYQSIMRGGLVPALTYDSPLIFYSSQIGLHLEGVTE